MQAQLVQNTEQNDAQIVRLKIEPHNDSDELDLILTSDSNFEEIVPNTFIKEIIDESHHIYNLTFRLFSNKEISIIHNEQWNTFNASKLAKALGKTAKQFKNWLSRNEDIQQYIDYVTKVIYNQRLKQNLISPTETIDSFKQKYIIYKLDNNKYTSIEKGSWLHYHLLPEVLRFASNKYRFIANNFESILLPTLTNCNETLESFNFKLNSFYEKNDPELSLISSIIQPVKKGQASEANVLKHCQTIFGESNVKSTNVPHSCDISILDGQILVEVKAVKRDFKDNDVKFINDLLKHQDTCKLGIYINVEDETIPTRFNINPCRWYINKSDFGDDLLRIIKCSIENWNTRPVDNKEVRAIIGQLPIQSLVEAFCSQAMPYLRSIVQAENARRSIDEDDDLSKYASTTDAKDSRKVEHDIKLAEVKEEMKQATKDFIKQNYSKFKYGYNKKQAKVDLADYLISNHFPKPTLEILTKLLDLYLDWERDASTTNGERVYKFANGTDNEFKPEDESSIIPIKGKIPTPEESFYHFFNLEETQSKLKKQGGWMSEKMTDHYMRIVDADIITKYNVPEELYRSKFKKLMLEHCIQVHRSSKRWYILNTTEEAKQILKKFDEFALSELKKSIHLKYNVFESAYGIYTKKYNNITRDQALIRLNDIKISLNGQ